MSDYLWVRETFVNDDDNVIFGESPAYETSFHKDEIGKLFRSCVREYGRCVSKIYIDRKSEEAIPIGWVFQKRMEYEDSRPYYDDYGRLKPPETYKRAVWVTVLDKDDTVVRTRHPIRIDKGVPL